MQLFGLARHGTNVRTGILAGCTTFLTMAYIIFLNPAILAEAEMGFSAVFVAGVAFVVLSVLPVREWLINAIPRALKLGIAAGIGLFLAFIALRNADWSSAARRRSSCSARSMPPARCSRSRASPSCSRSIDAAFPAPC